MGYNNNSVKFSIISNYLICIKSCLNLKGSKLLYETYILATVLHLKIVGLLLNIYEGKEVKGKPLI